MAAVVAALPVLAAPISQSDAPKEPASSGPASLEAAVPAAGQGEVPSFGTNLPVLPGGRAGEKHGDLGFAAPTAPASLPRRPATAVPVEEEPRVDLADVVESVVRATAASIPWFRLGRGAHDGAVHAAESAQAELAAQIASRVEYERAHRTVADPGRDESGSPTGLRRDLVEEAIEIARDLIANPVTWIVGLPLLLLGFIFFVLRGQTK